jgi:dihydroorotase
VGVDLDTVVTNARWLNPDGKFDEGYIVISSGRISKLGRGREPDAGSSVDARGMTVLPGSIDSHTHFREPGQMYKEGIWNGSRAALKGGVTTVLDMPNNKPPCNTLKRLEEKKNRFTRKCLVNWGLHVEASGAGNVPPSSSCASAKIYMAKSSASRPLTDVAALAAVFSRYRIISIHAEDETKFIRNIKTHHIARPKEAIASALEKIESAYESTPENVRPRVVLCHISTSMEVDWLAGMKRKGADIWGETCPHYLFFTQDDYLTGGSQYKVNTPLREESDRRAVIKALAEGPIDFLSTDHAPHTPAEKASADPPSGIASIEWYQQLLLHLVDKGRLSWKRFHEVSSANAAACYEIESRGEILEGNWADLTAVSDIRDPSPSLRDDIITKAAFNPYGGFDFKKEVVTVLVNGNVCYRDGEYVGKRAGMEVYI